MIADKGYIGECDQIITPIRNPRTEEEFMFNSIIYSMRIIVENCFRRIKSFNCLYQEWRQDLSLHPIAFTVICNIVNIDLCIRPLRK